MRRALTWAAAVLAFAAAVVWSAWPLPRVLATHVVDAQRLSPVGLWARADLDLLLWILAWDAHALATAPFSVFQGNMFYPARDVLASSEHLLGLAPVAAPVFLARGNAVAPRQPTPFRYGALIARAPRSGSRPTRCGSR